MKKYAGLDLNTIDITTATWEQIQSIQLALIENFKRSGLVAKGINYPDKIITHLDNYIRLTFIPTLDLDQAMALAIKCLPRDTMDPENDFDAMVLSIRKILADSDYTNKSVAELERIIAQKHVELSLFKNDWDLSVRGITAVIRKENISTAIDQIYKLKQLAAQMEPQNKKISTDDRMLGLSLQFVYAVEILQYFYKVQELLDDDRLMYAYVSMQIILDDSFKDMQKIIRENSAPIATYIKANKELLFNNCLPLSYKVEAPTHKLRRANSF